MAASLLYWEASYEIVLALMDYYPSAVVEELGIHQLKKMIIDLPDFADDPVIVSEEILNGILREWYEESTI